MKISIVGVTGLVGSVILKVLEERGFTDWELLPVASERSVGKEIIFNGKKLKVISVTDAIAAKPDIAIFSAGGSTSLRYAPLFADKGTYVIDNSSAWRMYDHIPLIVPEINGSTLRPEDKIIANPNCSTIQMVLALAPLHETFKIKRIVVSTYQSVSGTGVKAVSQLMSERGGEKAEMAYPHPIDLNVLPHGGDFEESGYTTEETKLINETHKILNDNKIRITSTVVRVPVTGGHSESVNVEFHNEYDLGKVKQLLKETPGITIVDNPMRNEYPMPLYAKGKDDVFVGRIRRDESTSHALNMWIVADNLRKGAATNAVQIAQLLSQNFLKQSK
ncbi:aspartate-semialdehyde dehydrogenase [Bacteroidales bacterium OttesenSCG-928-B11]|nr:aspartate-semialdehyde dehydrogenase [Bacteroidales bacterium OttesenSCG-928-C03]MDL2311373.1 aspartate-semialdehyde dehydrogenase [Bacteroidales bacterium OttesenSCG-928-B11]MDL2326013.1 aspartate-semialdehyde dehydrogenase [Bacteroidales bacterium OttesenSCG-928-A14]